MSTFIVPVIRIEKLEKHPEADTLSITEAEGCPVICKTADFNVGDLAIYIPVEAVVPLSDPRFAFLSTKEGKKTHRIKAKKLRGIFSMGLLMPFTPPERAAVVATSLGWDADGAPSRPLTNRFQDWVGVDVAEELGITKYVEPESTGKNMRLGAARREKDSSTAPIYDIESYRKYRKHFVAGEPVVVTEKIHGCNGRFVFRQGTGEEGMRLFVGSRNFFTKETADNVWWTIARRHGLEEKLARYPNHVLYGEVYGQVQDLKYGTSMEDPLRFAAFDIYNTETGKYLDYAEFKRICAELELPTVPVLYEGPYVPEIIEPLALGQSTIAEQIKEGFVIKPVVERFNRNLGRVILKLVGEQYLLRKGGTEFQ